MKYTDSTYSGRKHLQWLGIMACFLLHAGHFAFCQVRVPFQIRTSTHSPERKTYSIKGDFAFIGNTNLTLVNYDATANNNNNAMQYVDIDNDHTTWNSSSAYLNFSNENGASNHCTNIVFAGLYWTGRSTPDGAMYSSNEFSIVKNIDGSPVTKNFNKKKIKLKGPQASNYSEFTANENAIYYPNSSDAFIYSAYTEVTDYVRQNGAGNYFAADIALVEGNGSSTGYSGGWGLIVIYENSKLKHRDITLFDGHAFVLNATSNGYDVEVNGFHTIQTGNVEAKMGIMASEGDVGLTGDYFQIQKNSDLNFTKLHHAENSDDNFFNSSNTSLGRNPALTNNTGIDIGTFSIPNQNNTVFGNNQTSTHFRYGTVGDTYAIFAIALAVDSYIPQVENTISIATMNNIPYATNTVALPGQEIELNVAVRNTEIESISNYQMVIPMPYNANYVAGSAQGLITNNVTGSNQNAIYFDPAMGSNGSLIWNYGTLPLPENPDTVLANLKFKITTTEDCYLLANNHCSSDIVINGVCHGIGSISGISFHSCPFILGKNLIGNCNGTTIKGPITIPIDASNFVQTHCQNASTIVDFSFCNGESNLPVSAIAAHFPPDCQFYDAYPITDDSVAFSDSTPLPIHPGRTLTYYAVPRNLGINCFYPFSLTQCADIRANSDWGITINSANGGVALNNILSNDTLNGQPVALSEIQLNVISSPNEGISLQGTNVVVAPGTAAGQYTLTYQICDQHNPTICQQANVNFSIISTQIMAEDNHFSVECSSSGIIGNVLDNDLLNGVLCQSNAVDISVVTSSNPNIVINALTGAISISDELSQGTYVLQYKISPKGNPSTFDIATVNIDVSDTTPPSVPLLNDLIDYCTLTVAIPTASDNCSGAVVGFTNDPVYYDTPGEYNIHWTFTDSSNNTSAAEQKVILKNNEDAMPGYGYVDCNLDNDYSLNIDLNTFLQEGINRNGQWTSDNHTPNLNGSIFSPYQAPTGNYDFQYRYSDSNCEQITHVTIEVNNDCFVAPACNLLVHNSFSPNNDGINEVFFIENIDETFCFPTNSVEIYNRWGVLVFKTNQYDNVNRVFRGVSDGRATINESNQLPTGTYYYTIKYTDEKGNANELVGYLYLVM